MFDKVRKAFKRDKKKDLAERREAFITGYNKLIEETRMCFKYGAEPLKKNPAFFQVIATPVDCTAMLEQVKAEKEAEEKKIKDEEALKNAKDNVAKDTKENK
jgi:hypothetical protein